MEDLVKKWCINERLHQMVLDWNATLKKEYQQMMSAPLCSPPEKPKLPMNSKPLVNVDVQTNFGSSN
jgi:hypothetical protein